MQLARCGASHEKVLAHELVDARPPGALDGAVVGGDALYADTALVRQLVQEQGAITLVQLKDNLPTVAARADKELAQAPLFSLPHSSPATAASISATCARGP